MIWRNKVLKRIFALALSAVLVGTSTDFSVLAAENTDVQLEQTVETDFEENGLTDEVKIGGYL